MAEWDSQELPQKAWGRSRWWLALSLDESSSVLSDSWYLLLWWYCPDACGTHMSSLSKLIANFSPGYPHNSSSYFDDSGSWGQGGDTPIVGTDQGKLQGLHWETCIYLKENSGRPFLALLVNGTECNLMEFIWVPLNDEVGQNDLKQPELTSTRAGDGALHMMSCQEPLVALP